VTYREFYLAYARMLAARPYLPCRPGPPGWRARGRQTWPVAWQAGRLLGHGARIFAAIPPGSASSGRSRCWAISPALTSSRECAERRTGCAAPAICRTPAFKVFVCCIPFHYTASMRVYLETLGCRLNYAEMAHLGRQLTGAGHVLAASADQADICVLNSCAVTGDAARKSRQLARKMARVNRAPGCWLRAVMPRWRVRWWRRCPTLPWWWATGVRINS